MIILLLIKTAKIRIIVTKILAILIIKISIILKIKKQNEPDLLLN